MGVNFSDCKIFLLALTFEDCQLNIASFYKLKLKGIHFKNCNLKETDFTETDLSNAILDNCDLTGAIFENTNLQKADFRTAFNYSINPEINSIKKAKFSLTGIMGLLNQYQIEIEL
jgi:uncharacterized protein YjbI with pentapeptide repeats